MPRTKRPIKKPAKASLDGDKAEILKKLDKMVAEQKRKLEDSAQLEVRALDMAFRILLGSISEKHLHMTVGQLKNELCLKEVTNMTQQNMDNTTPAVSQDDGYLTENSSHGSGDRMPAKHMAPPSTRGRRSRSADASRSKAPASVRTAQRRRSRSVYRTPAYNKSAAFNYPPITPKMAPDTPLTVLRQPRLGEMVVSMTGSPVMVPTYSSMRREEKANCNILLNDGTMLTLQPKTLRQSQAHIPFALMDSSVMHQLETLKNSLEMVVMMSKKEAK